MKKNSLLLFVIISWCISCKKEIDPFLITKHSIGHLTDSTQVKNLDAIFFNDSITKYISGDEFTRNINDIEIYEKGGKHLLELSPSQPLDSMSKIRTVRIIDSRYTTTKGLTSISTFNTIRDNYKISSIQNTLRSIIVSVNDINAYFTIDKNELPANMRYDMNLKIEAIQIPDEAKIRTFYLFWVEK